MRFLQVALLVAALTLTVSSTASAQGTLPMHSVDTGFGICQIGDPCATGVDVEANLGVGIAAYLLARNYASIAGAQTAFDWGSWAFTFGLWDCQPNQLSAVSPAAPGGATAGTIATAFDCVMGGQTIVIGRIHLVPTAPGCVIQVESSFPFGTHYVDCTATVRPVPPEGRGSICAGSAGVDACQPIVPVEAMTWGAIKNHYQ